MCRGAVAYSLILPACVSFRDSSRAPTDFPFLNVARRRAIYFLKLYIARRRKAVTCRRLTSPSALSRYADLRPGNHRHTGKAPPTSRVHHRRCCCTSPRKAQRAAGCTTPTRGRRAYIERELCACISRAAGLRIERHQVDD